MGKEKLAKKANILFGTTVVLSLIANLFVSLLSVKGISLPIVPNLLISQTIIVIPGLIFYLLISKESVPFKIYGKIKPVSVLLLVVFTWLLMPLVSLANLFSQIFTKNEVMNISGEVLDIPIVPMILIIGLLGPFCEEFVFRGLINNCFVHQSKRYVASALVSGAFFGLMHMNFNQFCYAVLLGFIFAIINEALGSTWPSFVCHAVVNTQNVITLYLMDYMMKKLSGVGAFEMYNSMSEAKGADAGISITAYIIMFVILLFLSIVTSILAGLLFYSICAIEGKKERLKSIFKKSDENSDTKILYPVGITAISFCIFVMFLLEPIINFLK